MDKRLCWQKVFYPCKLIDSSINRMKILLKECLTFEAICIEPRTTQKCYSQNNFSVEPKRQTPSSHKMPHNILKQISHDNFLKTDNKITKKYTGKEAFKMEKGSKSPAPLRMIIRMTSTYLNSHALRKITEQRNLYVLFKGQPLISFVVAN